MAGRSHDAALQSSMAETVKTIWDLWTLVQQCEFNVCRSRLHSCVFRSPPSSLRKAKLWAGHQVALARQHPTHTYLSRGWESPGPGAPVGPGAPAGPGHRREPRLSAHWPGRARGPRPGPRCRSGGSHSPLLPPGPPQPRNTQQGGVSIGGGWNNLAPNLLHSKRFKSECTAARRAEGGRLCSHPARRATSQSATDTWSNMDEALLVIRETNNRRLEHVFNGVGGETVYTNWSLGQIGMTEGLGARSWWRWNLQHKRN